MKTVIKFINIPIVAFVMGYVIGVIIGLGQL